MTSHGTAVNWNEITPMMLGQHAAPKHAIHFGRFGECTVCTVWPTPGYEPKHAAVTR